MGQEGRPDTKSPGRAGEHENSNPNAQISQRRTTINIKEITSKRERAAGSAGEEIERGRVLVIVKEGTEHLPFLWAAEPPLGHLLTWATTDVTTPVVSEGRERTRVPG